MSKYEPLWRAIAERSEDRFALSFEEIKDLGGIEIDHSFLTFKKELPAYGYSVVKISLKGQTVTFERLK